jgi:kumamolisin
MDVTKIALALVLAGGCAATETGGVVSHRPARVQTAVEVGSVAADEPIDLVLSLRRHATVELKTFLRARAGASLTPREFADRYGATPDEYQRVLDWAATRHLNVVRTTPSRTTVSLVAAAADAAAAFHTRLAIYEDRRGTFRAPAVEVRFDPEVADLIEAVVGLDDVGRWNPKLKAPPAPSPNAANAAQTPSDLAKLYQVDQVTFRGEGETVAILGTGFGPGLTTDIDPFIKQFSLPTKRTAQYTQVLLGGANRDSKELANVEYGENVLDIDMVFGLAPLSNVVQVITATNTPGLFNDGIVFIINQVPQAHAVSVSYGTCERVADSEMVGLNHLFQQAKAQGQQWFIASGDDGSEACSDQTMGAVLSVDWPSASPFVLGVGGTELQSNGTEVAWDGSGGGQSEINEKPDFQIGIGPYPNDGVRDVPDVASLAGNPGVVTVVQGRKIPSAGTSAAAPMWASMWSLVDQSQGGGGIRNAAERLYQLGAAGKGAFHDIVVGVNNVNTVGYKALPGYDLATGWGSPNVLELTRQWQ